MKKGLLLQYDDRSPTWGTKLIERNKIAACNLEFDHMYLNKCEFDETIPPYWRKVFLVEKYIKSGYPFVVWIDSDAVLVNEAEFQKCIDIEMKDVSMAFSSNPGILRKEGWPFRLWAAPFCAGVFIVKNTESSLDILKDWKNSFDPSLWSKSKLGAKQKWEAIGTYGGESYEQGSFEIHIFRSAKHRKNLLQFKHTRLNYLPIKGEPCETDTIFLHYWNGNRMRILRDWGQEK